MDLRYSARGRDGVGRLARACSSRFGFVAGALSLALLLLTLPSCDGADRAGDVGAGEQIELVRVSVGRLIDVYGFESATSKALLLYRKDVLVAPDIVDERQANDSKSDDETRYDFVGVDPATLQPRLLIPRPVESEEFRTLVEALDDKAMTLDARTFGDNAALPFRAVPRNAAFRLEFSRSFELPEDFFVARDEIGRITGVRNPEAVQLLEILSDPNDASTGSDFRLIPSRILHRGSEILLDPVLLADEARELALPPNAQGLPPSVDGRSANLRLALSLEGPLRIRGLADRGDAQGLVGTNLSGRRSVIRDFRTGNASDSTFWVSNGFVRDDTPPRLIGEMPMRLARVEIRSERDQRLILFKAGISHDIDLGDALRLIDPETDESVASASVADEPADDDGNPSAQFVTVRVRDAQPFERLDPSRRSDWPSDPDKLEEWLTQNAPVCVLQTEFQGSKDDALNFLSFTPKPRPSPGESRVALNRNIAPNASVVLRFTKPIDMSTARPLDSLIFATHAESRVVLDAKLGTPHLILGQIFDEDGSQTRIRSLPPQGFFLNDEMRKSENANRFPYYLHLIGGFEGIRDLAGKPLDLQFDDVAQRSVAIPFFLDTSREASGSPRFANNRVINIARRFKDRDEDEDQDGLEDAFGAIVYLNGRIQGRPTSRSSSFVDDRNQLPSPPTPPLSYCAAQETMLLTGASPVGIPIQNPLQPLGARLQMIWRDFDLSLSRTNPFDFNLDVEAIWWAPFQSTQNAGRTEFDIYDDISLTLGHCERRPSNCVRIPASLPSYPNSGLREFYYHNYLRDVDPSTASTAQNQTRDAVVSSAARAEVFRSKSLTISESQAVFEPNGINRFLPLPEFDNKRYTWRDERLMETGGGDGLRAILGPFRTTAGNVWDGLRFLPNEDGRVGALALPLLADFSVQPDDPELPKDDPWSTTGVNGWQVSLTVASDRRPDFRAYSAGQQRSQTERIRVNPGEETRARGGWDPINNRATPGRDNTVYWACIDFLKRQSVMTFGFVDLEDPHNDEELDHQDPRLGPYALGSTGVPKFTTWFDPPLSAMPRGTRLLPQYRGADRFLDTTVARSLDPRIAGNAHIRIARSPVGTGWANWQHTERLTSYVEDIEELSDADFLRQFTAQPSGKARESMSPETLRLLNWRFIFENNVDIEPSPSPELDSFAIVYRIEDAR